VSKTLYAAAARYFAEAFDHDAKLADGPWHRYNAACFAALAGCGHGKDADKLDDQELARLRKQAIAWLRAHLGFWTGKAQSKNPADCRIVTVCTFQGNRSRAFTRAYDRAMDADRKHGRGGPSIETCLLSAGHTGVSIDGRKTIYALNPDFPSTSRISEVMDDLAAGLAFPGIVRDDTPIFAAATRYGLKVQAFDVLYPDATFAAFQQSLNDEIKGSRFTYGFPDGNGDCNCTTWLERIGLPLLTGRMREFTSLTEIKPYPIDCCAINATGTPAGLSGR
jgi:hypothetical protein